MESDITDTLLERLYSMKKKGMYRYLGINTHRQSDMTYVAKHPEIFDAVLIDYNVLQLEREAVIEKLYGSGIGIMAGTVLGQGHLIEGKIGSLSTLADIWYLARATLKSSSRRLARYSKEMRETLSSVEEMSSAQAAFAYVLENPAIATCVFGTTKIENLIEVIDVVDRKLSERSKISIRNTFKSLESKISD